MRGCKRLFVLIFALSLNQVEPKVKRCRSITTEVTTFFDLPDRLVSYEKYVLRLFITVNKEMLRDPCYEMKLYQPLMRRSIELDNINEIDYQFEKVIDNLKQIEKIELKKYVEKLNDENMTGRRKIILYVRHWDSKDIAYMELAKLKDGENIFTIMSVIFSLQMPVYFR